MMEERNVPTIQVSENVVDRDIQLFIQDQLASHPRLRKWPAKSRLEIQESLANGSQGMFRWVCCQVEVIAKCVTPRDLRRALSSLPKSLSAAYTSIIAQIEEFHWEYAMKILLWLAISSEPLRIEEAADTLTIDFEAEEGPSFDPDLRLQDVGDIIDISSTLVTPCKILRQHENCMKEFTELRLAHHTVKEYLLSDVFKARFTQPVPFAGKEEVHGFAAKTSIAYLLSLHEPLVPATLDERPLSRHAARFWLSHYVAAGNDPELTGLSLRLLASDGKTEPYRNWCRLHDPTRPWKEPNFDRDAFPDPLYYARNCGVERLVSRLLEEGSDPAIKGEVHASCLQSAAYKGHHRIVETLLQAGVDPMSAVASMTALSRQRQHMDTTQS